MMAKQLVAILFLAAFTMGCNNLSKNESYQAADIELNDGKKWVVNAEMTPFILEAEQMLMQYDGSDYKKLSEQLESKNKGLIKSCTMDGKSHEELHKWLYPHMQLIEALGDAESRPEADTIISQLKSSFQTYHTYFQ